MTKEQVEAHIAAEFAKAMEGRQYGQSQTDNARSWFALGVTVGIKAGMDAATNLLK